MASSADEWSLSTASSVYSRHPKPFSNEEDVRQFVDNIYDMYLTAYESEVRLVYRSNEDVGPDHQDPDWYRPFIKTVRKNKQYTVGLMPGNKYGQPVRHRLLDKDIPHIISALRTRNVQILNLPYNRIKDDGILTIANFLKQNSSLKILNLMGNEFTGKGAANLFEALRENMVLKELRINGNNIGKEGGLSAAETIGANTNLASLDLGSTSLTIEPIVAIITMLQKNSNLNSITLNNPLLIDSDSWQLTVLNKLLKINSSLVELQLKSWNIQDSDLELMLSPDISEFPLQCLDLGQNHLGEKSAIILSRFLKQFDNLVILQLSTNSLKDIGAYHISMALTETRLLKFLNLESNQITGLGLSTIAEALIYNCTLAEILLWGNEFDELACEAFWHLEEENILAGLRCDIKPYLLDNKPTVCRACVPQFSTRSVYYEVPRYGDKTDRGTMPTEWSRNKKRG